MSRAPVDDIVRHHSLEQDRLRAKLTATNELDALIKANDQIIGVAKDELDYIITDYESRLELDRIELAVKTRKKLLDLKVFSEVANAAKAGELAKVEQEVRDRRDLIRMALVSIDEKGSRMPRLIELGSWILKITKDIIEGHEGLNEIPMEVTTGTRFWKEA